MIFGVIIGLILALCVALVVLIAKDPGPRPDDAAVSYEMAWDRLDFDVLWTLSGTELRDGLDRKHFVATKRAAYASQHALRGLVVDVSIDDVVERGDIAVVTTRVSLRDRTAVRNRLQLARRSRRWQVVAYQLVSDTDPSRTQSE